MIYLFLALCVLTFILGSWLAKRQAEKLRRKQMFMAEYMINRLIEKHDKSREDLAVDLVLDYLSADNPYTKRIDKLDAMTLYQRTTGCTAEQAKEVVEQIMEH